MPASVTVDGWGSGSDLDSFSDASLEPPAIAVYNPYVLGVYLVLIIPHMDESFLMFFEYLSEGSFPAFRRCNWLHSRGMSIGILH